jgi:hypothetical protein
MSERLPYGAAAGPRAAPAGLPAPTGPPATPAPSTSSRLADRAAAPDTADPLAPFRDRFALHGAAPSVTPTRGAPHAN